MRLALILGITFGTLMQMQTNPAQPNKADKKQSSSAHGHTQYHSEGERIFVQNCARCHTPPDGFAPRISGTILRHMRVRASLSAHDEEELLHYFNP